MIRSLASIRRVSMALGVLFISHGALAQGQTDAATQRLAMARTHTPETAHPQAAPVARPAAARRAGSDSKTAKLQVRRSSEQRSEATASSDGNRFAYDSCGCSND
jgi:hypothetical protein